MSLERQLKGRRIFMCGRVEVIPYDTYGKRLDFNRTVIKILFRRYKTYADLHGYRRANGTFRAGAKTVLIPLE